MRIVILGSPGSGKKTQASLLAEKYQLTILTVSDLVKHAQAEQSERGEQMRLMLQRGQSPAEEVILELLQDRISQPDMRNGFILDGFPRNLLQALTLDEVLAELGLPIDFVLLYEIETDALMERLVGRRTCRSCGTVYNVYTQPTAVEDVCDQCGGRLHQRADDTEETVSSRLHVFDHLTGPLLSHYGKQEKVLRVNGEGDRDQVFELSCRTVDAFLSGRPASQGIAEAAVAGEPGDEGQGAPEAEEVADRQTTPIQNEKPAGKSSLPTGGAPADKRTAKKKIVKKLSPKKAAPKKSAPKKPASKKTTPKRAAPKKAMESKTKAPSKARSAAKQTKSGKKAATKKRPVAAKPVKKAGTAKSVKRSAAKKSTATGKSASRKQATATKAKKKVLNKKVVKKPSISRAKSQAAAKKKVAKKPAVKKTTAKKASLKRPVTKKKLISKAPANPAGKKKTVTKKAPAKKKLTARPAKSVKKKLVKKSAGSQAHKKKAAKKRVTKKKVAKKTAKRATRRR